MPAADDPPILGAMTITNTSRRLCPLLVALVLSSGCRDATPNTLPMVRSCLTDHGATVRWAGFPGTGEVLDEPGIGDFDTGSKGIVNGTCHGYDFQVELYDKVYLTELSGSEEDFEPLDTLLR